MDQLSLLELLNRFLILWVKHSVGTDSLFIVSVYLYQCPVPLLDLVQITGYDHHPHRPMRRIYNKHIAY